MNDVKKECEMPLEASYDYGWWAATVLNILLFGGFVLKIGRASCRERV